MTSEAIVHADKLLARRSLRTVVDSVDLVAYPGDRIYLTGDNGSGKSTLLEALLGLLPSTARSRSWLGAPGTPRSEKAFAKGTVTYVRQYRNLFPSLSLISNLTLGVRSTDLHDTLSSYLQDYPELLDSLSRTPSQSSAGQRQLAAALRFLVQHPRLLVLDEPTAGIAAPLVTRFYQTLTAWERRVDAPAIILTDQHYHEAEQWANITWRVSEMTVTTTPKGGRFHEPV